MMGASLAEVRLSPLERFIYECKDDPVRFATTIFTRHPVDSQIEALNTLAKRKKIAIKSGHGVGKSGLFPYVGYWLLFCRIPVKVVITAPTKHQLYDIAWPEFAILKRYMLPEFAEQLSWIGDKISLKGAEDECFIIPRTSRKEVPEALQGLHGENIALLIDEASGVHDQMFIVGEGMLTTESTYVVAASNPTRRKGWFFNLFNKDRAFQEKYWALKTISCLESSLVTKEYIQYMKDKYGEDSDTYRVRVLGEFPKIDADSYINEEIVRNSVNREIEAQPFYEIWGLDVARKGNNKTVLTRRNGRKLIEQIVWSKLDTMQICGRVVDLYDEARESNNIPNSINIDIIGVGSGVYDRLSELGLPVVAVHSGSESSSKDTHLNYRMDLWADMRDWFEGVASIPEDDELIDQICSVPAMFSSSGKMRMATKDELITLGVTSPDKADSLMLTFADRDMVRDSLVEEVKEQTKRYSHKRRVANGTWMST